MRMSSGFKIALMFFLSLGLLSSCLSFSLANSWISKQDWLTPGAYAEYSFGEGVVEVYNASTKLGFDFTVFSKATFKWSCLDVNETIAELRIVLSLNETSRNGMERTQSRLVNIIEELYINLETRGVHFKNGTLIGTTHLWIYANPILGESVLLWDVSPYSVTSNISNHTAIAPDTPQGQQEVFKIEGNGDTGGPISLFTMLCDIDTGILVDGGLNNEGTMRALGIRDFSYNGRMLFIDTNIDLGPKNSSLDAVTIFTVISIPIAFAIIFIGVYMQKRKR